MNSLSIPAKIGRALVALVAVGALAGQAGVVWAANWVVDHHQWVADRAIALQFEPGPELAEYAEKVQFTAEGEIYFYASRPQVVPALEFDNYCSRNEPGIGVLGCYRLQEQRMYLYDVTDERLAAMEPVIAAHETLHAVWDRFDRTTKDDLAVLLEEAFSALPEDHPMRERIISYEEYDPNSRIPELYALLGTEVGSLPDALEDHYARYFTDRQQVVALAAEVYGIFNSFGAELDSLVADLDARLTVIDARKARYELDAEILGADIAIYNNRVSRYNDGEDVQGAAGFEAEQKNLVQRQNALRAERSEVENLIDEYNELLDQLNTLNQELTELNQGINITLEEEEELGEIDAVEQAS